MSTRLIWIVCFILVAAAGTAHANTITVSFTGVDGVADGNCTFNEALNGGFAECAPTGPAGPLIIQLPAGTRTWTVGMPLPGPVSGTMIIRGAGASSTTLAAVTAEGGFPLLVIDGGAITIEGITFTGWRGAQTFGGGAIRQRVGTGLTVRDCVFRDNHSMTQIGGAISSGDDVLGASTTSLTIERTTFEANMAAEAGAIWAAGANVTIVDSVFVDNQASQYGAVRILTRAAGQDATVRGTRFTNNAASDASLVGAISLEGAGVLTAEDCVFTGNHAGQYGALFLGGNGTVDGCTFQSNSATNNRGGALVVDNGVHLVDSVFIGNTAVEHGAAFACQGGGLECLVERTRFERNAAGEGGAIFGGSSLLTVRDSVFFDNVATRTLDLTLVATDNMATEGGDTGRFVVDHRVIASAIRHQGTGAISGNCFLGAAGAVILGPVDARGNFWTSADPTVRGTGGADTSDGLAVAPAGCDTSLVPTGGGATFPASYPSTPTSGTDYVALPTSIVFAPAISTITLEVIALPDAIAEATEYLQMDVGDLGGPPGSFGAYATVFILDGAAAACDVSVEKTVDRDRAAVGDEIVYTLTVTNDGTGVASDVEITDTLPSGLMLVGVDAEGPAGVTVTCMPSLPPRCTLSALAPGESATVTVRARATTAGAITNRAEVSATGDSNAANDSDEVLVTVLPAGSDAGIPRADAGAESDSGVIGGDSGVIGGDGGGIAGDGGGITGDGGGITGDGGLVAGDAGEGDAGEGGTAVGCGCRAQRGESNGLAWIALLAVFVHRRLRRRSSGARER